MNETVNNNSKSASDVITIKKNSLWKYSTFILLAVLIVGAFLFFQRDSPTGQVINEPGQQLPPANQRVEIDIKDSPIKGKDNAPVVMVEYSDYECPFCGRFYSQTLPQIQKDYIDTGKVKLVFKDFPLSFHPNAQKAAEAARCARDQKGVDAYWAMHDKIFENQQALSIDNYKKWAQEIGLDATKFSTCLSTGKFASSINEDLQEGQKIGVQGTPAFFINGKLISGAQPFAVFQQAIEAEL